MSNVPVKKSNAEPEKQTVAADFARRFDEIRRRAYELFENRGFSVPGQELEDWFKAERELFSSPAAELTENGKQYDVQIALPGFEAKDIEVTATANELVVKAKTEHEKKSEEDKVVWSEFGSNEVYRRLTLPGPALVDQITAKLDKGVLKVTVPKVTVKKEPANEPIAAKEAPKEKEEEKMMAASAA